MRSPVPGDGYNTNRGDPVNPSLAAEHTESTYGDNRARRIARENGKIPTGHFLAEVMKSNGVDGAALSEKLGITEDVLSASLHGNYIQSRDIVAKIAALTGKPFEFWRTAFTHPSEADSISLDMDMDVSAITGNNPHLHIPAKIWTENGPEPLGAGRKGPIQQR